MDAYNSQMTLLGELTDKNVSIENPTEVMSSTELGKEPTTEELITKTLRQEPNRIILGELREPTAFQRILDLPTDGAMIATAYGGKIEPETGKAIEVEGDKTPNQLSMETLLDNAQRNVPDGVYLSELSESEAVKLVDTAINGVQNTLVTAISGSGVGFKIKGDSIHLSEGEES